MIWTFILGVLTISLSSCYFLWQALKGRERESKTPSDQDHPLLANYSELKSYTTQYGHYPGIRSFYHPHSHADKLEVIADLPLLIFIHGLGGSLVQFTPLLGSLVKIAPCFGIDLPGHGRSLFAPTTYEAYSTEALVSLTIKAIEVICWQHGQEKVVLIAHSMGCSIAALLSSSMPAHIKTKGIVAICPIATPPTRLNSMIGRRLLVLPNLVLETLRYLDRRGGEESKSVKRFVGKGADIDLKKLQLKFNRQTSTSALKRTMYGCIPIYDEAGEPNGGIPGRSVWRRIRAPLLLIAGEDDIVTRPIEATKIVSFLRECPDTQVDNDDAKIAATILATNTQDDESNPNRRSTSQPDDQGCGVLPESDIFVSKNSASAVVKNVILPSPAAHALMYAHSTYRTVAGLIEDFLAHHVSPQLELGWQLQHLTTSGKWDVKNLEKWKKVAPVSGTIGDGLFRALKTLREQDEKHTPSVFIRNWKDEIFAVIDISHDSPVYDSKALEKGGIQYHKFPTVSKVPPTVVEVADFIALIDRIRQDQAKDETAQGKAIGVHCHYGYNRTGFFIACYLIERKKYRVQDAIEEFASQKPPGIKHDHFIDTLFVRYCVGLKKAPTLNGLKDHETEVKSS